MPDVTLRGAVDTYASAAYPSTNYATARRLGLNAASAYAYMYFTRPMPLGAIVTSARLRLYYDGTWTASTLTAQRLSSSLAASRVNWNAKPGVTGGVSTPATAPAGPLGTMVEVDVKAIMQAVADGAPWYGLRIATAGGARYLTSSNGESTRRPQLYVAWSEAPHAPTGLAPDGNHAVSVTKPVVRFTVTDTLGDTTIGAVNVQTDNAADFVGAFDSGWIDTDEPALDLATLTAPAFPALTAGQSIFWRVRVKDGAGLISKWSDDAQLRYVAKGTVTIDNPAAGSAPYVTEPTPPILWSFTGATQKRWQVFILDPVHRSKVLANSGVRTSSETDWKIPAGVLTTPGPYRLVIRVWDGVNRDASDAYASATRDFVLKHDSSVTVVTGLAVSQPTPWPGVLLSWTRGSAPDSWVIERNGNVIDPEVLPEDSLVSGTTYQFEDPNAKSWRWSTWKVRAKVNGKMSDSTTVNYLPSLRGIWLMDKSRGIRVWLAGDDGGTWTEPEDATALAPLGGTKVVRVVQGLRNYEGSLAGQLVTAFGRSAVSYEDDLLRLRDEPTNPVILAVADYSLRVLLGNIQVTPTPNHVPPSRLVTFDFWEV